MVVAGHNIIISLNSATSCSKILVKCFVRQKDCIFCIVYSFYRTWIWFLHDIKLSIITSSKTVPIFDLKSRISRKR